MFLHQITDWDDAYSNGIHIAGGQDYPSRWEDASAAFRARMMATGRAEIDLAYGEGERHKLDLFHPEGFAKGLVVIVHGGYWLAFDKNRWSHLAEGALAHGYAVALPSYSLCPAVKIGSIVREVARAVEWAADRIGGPIRLTGHSAGGHLVTRMICKDSPLAASVQARITRTVSISGLHDLRPLMQTAMNGDLAIHPQEALEESPALLLPMPAANLVCWVGGAERSEFLRQSALLTNIWTGLGAATALTIEPDRHHFNIIDGLKDSGHPLVHTLLAD